MKAVTFAALALVSALAADTARSEDKPAGGKFAGTADLPDKVQMVTNFSRDQQAVTVVFRNLQAASGGVKGMPLVDTRIATVSLPLDGKDATRLTQDIRGYYNVVGKARAVLIVQAAGKTTTVDLKKSAVKPPKPDKDKPREPRPGEGTTGYFFEHRIEGTVPAGTSYQVTFVLLVERDVDADDAGGLLVIDSFDAQVAPPAAKK